VETDLEDYISENLLKVVAVVNKYRVQYPMDSTAQNYGENPREVLYNGEKVVYESLYSYVTDSDINDENYQYTDFTCDNGNVVMVTYMHPTSGDKVVFILNYNNFVVNVRLAPGEKPISIDAYAYYKQ
jgi:hypothetical protein